MTSLLFSVLLIIFSADSFANGVVTGDGHPTILTKQERLDSTGVDNEMENIVENLAAFNPIAAHLLNVGVRALKEKKLVLIKIVDESHDHFAYIEDARVRIDVNGPRYYVLNSQPTIYFYKNYFDLNNQNSNDPEKVTKVKIIIHEFMHMYLGSSELKVQRVTDLIYKISTGHFEDADLANLSFELSPVIEKLNLGEHPSIYYGCEIDIGLKRMKLSEFGGGYKTSLTIPPQYLIDNFNSISESAKTTFKKNLSLYYKVSRITYGPGSHCDYTNLKLTSLNFDSITYKNFVQHIYNNGLIWPRDLTPTPTQLKEIRETNIPISSYYFSLNFQNYGNDKYDVKVSYNAITSVRIPTLKEATYIKTYDFESASDILKLYENAKSLYLSTGIGSVSDIYSTKINEFVVPAEGRVAKLDVGSYRLREIKPQLGGVYEYQKDEILDNSTLTISLKNITFSSTVIKTIKNISPITPFKLESIIAPVKVEVIE